MYILGINAYHGDSSACLLKDGVILCAIEEERIRRIKHWAGFPSESIKFCLKDANISFDDIDFITISRNPKANFIKKIVFLCNYPNNFFNVFNRFRNSKKIINFSKDISNFFNVPYSKIKNKLRFVEHHRSHMASSFFASAFKNSAIISIDGFGDFTSTMTAVGTNNNINVLNQVNYPHSIGIFYTAATQFLGFSNYGDEYKVMGLSSYGSPKYLKLLDNIISKNSQGFFSLNSKYFNHFHNGVQMNWNSDQPKIGHLYNKNWENLFDKPRLKEDNILQFHMDLAASVQKHTENIILYMIDNLYEKTDSENLCISGGVAQNSVINGQILKKSKFKNIYTPPASHDAGTSIGSALYLYNHILKKNRAPKISSAYYGSKFNHNDIIKVLNKQKINYKIFDENDLIIEVAKKLANGNVIGWFQGRSEFGPRALGHRSILVDPRNKNAKDLLNKKIKIRESFRPFAPSILDKFVSDYFDIHVDSLFMEKVISIKEDKHKIVPAITHVDGTGRLHTVSKDISPKYFKLISEFFKITGVPILLNTSFNENEPIVNSPSDALNCYLRTEMDMLVLENIIIERES